MTDKHWWDDAVFYQIYIRSFADADGDGSGDLTGIKERLPYLKDLGVDALWITPFYTSPQADGGYDVADPRAVDPLYGNLEAFDSMLAEAKRLGLRVTIDVVPNHSSDQHEWFQAALKSAPGSPERERYIFRDAPDGALPNNWPAVFGGPAWERTADGQVYLHLFAPEQPDINWDNPAAAADLDKTLRFWLERGVDGFRVDVAHGMAKPIGLPDLPELDAAGNVPDGAVDFRWDNDAVHDIHREIRRTVDFYPDAVTVGEVWVTDRKRLARYLRPDELHMCFNFRLAESAWTPDELRVAIEESLKAVEGTGTPACWVLSNHDISRHATRYGGGDQGRARARAAALLQLALPGTPFIYQGDELGLEDVHVPDDALRDPTWERSGHSERGRDGCRVPIPWAGEASPYDFSTTPDTWLPMPERWAHRTVKRQLGDPASHLALYRTALAIRRSRDAFGDGSLRWLDGPDALIAFARGDGLVCALNLTGGPVDPPAGKVLLSSTPLDSGALPHDAAVWVETES